MLFITASIDGVWPRSFAMEAALLSGKPQGLIWEKCSRFGLTLRANPCMVTRLRTLRPMAAISLIEKQINRVGGEKHHNSSYLALFYGNFPSNPLDGSI